MGSPTSLPCSCRRLRLLWFFFFNDTATTEIYTLSLHDALPIYYEAELETVEPGRTWRLTVKPAAGISPGRYDDTLELESSDAAIGMIRLPVHVLVKAEIGRAHV